MTQDAIHAKPDDRAASRFWGKYRGRVIENLDPSFLGRIIAEVPAVSGSMLNWAMPCVPYAGPNVGFYAIPPVGANVWIEFEGGDPNYPIWTGCFWAPEDMLHVPAPPPPEVKVFKTEFVTMILDDTREVGGFSLRCNPAAVDIPLTMLFNSEGITILCPESSIKMTPGSITLSIPDAVQAMMPEAITLAVSDSSIQMGSAEISMVVPASCIDIGGEAILIESRNVDITETGQTES